MLMWMVRRYPRHSMAALASIVILGGILYSQSGSGTTRRTVTNAIAGNGSSEKTEGKSEAPPADAATKVAGDPKAGEGSDKEKVPPSDPAKLPKTEKTDVTIAQTEGGAQPTSPAPKRSPASPTWHPPRAVAHADQPPAKDEQKPEAAPAPAPAVASVPAVSIADPGLVPLPAPTGETAKATLLSGTPPQEHATPPAPVSSAGEDKGNANSSVSVPAPATDQPVVPSPTPAPHASGEQVAKTDPMPEIPADLLLPDGVPKAADEKSNEKPKDSKTSEVAPAATTPVAAPSGESKPVAEPKKADGPAPQPIEPAVKLPGEPAPALSGASEPPATIHPQKPDESKLPEPSKSNAAPGPAPVLAPVPEAAEHTKNDEKVAMPPGEPAESKPLERESSSKKGVEDGWIPIPNAGSLPVDPDERAVGQPDPGGLERGSGSTAAADSRFHAKRAIDFEPEPSQSHPIGGGATPSARRSGGAEAAGAALGAAAGAGAAEHQPRAASHMERVEATEHVVERGENYWIISRQYWGSGRYFAALWKANSANHPDIDVLHVGDVIIVPAIEDLNPDYILPPGKTASAQWLASLGIKSRASRGSKTGAGGDETDAGLAGETRRTRPASGQGSVPARRAIQSDSEDDSDRSVTASGGDRSTSYKGRSAAAAQVFDGDSAGNDQEVRTAARPRGGSAAGSGSKPVYRVRAYDTLRSIARDTLGSSRRADEILELNRGVIDDPGQLVVGQVLELPEDARGGFAGAGAVGSALAGWSGRRR